MSQEHHHAYMILVKTKRRQLDWTISVKEEVGLLDLHAKNIIKEIIDYYRRTIIGDLNIFKKAIPFSNIEKRSAYSTCKLEKAGALTKESL